MKLLQVVTLWTSALEVAVLYKAPNDRTFVTDPTPEELESELRDQSHSYWQQGGNGEATLDAGSGEPSLWISQPESGLFFMTFSHPPANWLVPYNGGPCEELVADERGGDPFLIPRACLVDTTRAIAVIRFFLAFKQPAPEVMWRYWHELPLPDEAVQYSGGG
jgi:hypothetical protein